MLSQKQYERLIEAESKGANLSMKTYAQIDEYEKALEKPKTREELDIEHEESTKDYGAGY